MNKHNYQKTNRAYLIQILQKFNPSVVEDSHISYPSLLHHFANLLNDSEKALIESILNTSLTIITLSRIDYHQLSHLKATHYIIPIGKNRYYFSPEFINDYNHYYLNKKYSPLPTLEERIHTKFTTLSLIEEKRRLYETMDFKTCLSNCYNTQNLNFICEMANIKNYNQLTDSEKCTLITKKVMRDFGLFEKLIEIVPPLRMLFAYLVYEDRNSFIGAELPGDNIAIFILFSDIEFNMLYLPCDLFEHLKQYFHLRGLQPESILKQSIEDFTGQTLDIHQQQLLLKALCHNQLTITEAKIILPELMHDKIPKKILTQLNSDSKTKFFEALVSLFGFIPIKIVVKLYNQFFDAHEISVSIVKLINEDYKSPTTAICNYYLTHVTLKDTYQTLDALYETIPYYLPPTLRLLIKAAEHESWIANKKFQDSIHFLISHINFQVESLDVPTAVIEATIFEDIILPNIKMVPKEDDLKDAIQMWKVQGLFNDVKTKQILKHVKILYSILRLWVYRGHTQREYYEMIHQYHTSKKTNTDKWNHD